MRILTGAYHLDAASAAFFEASKFRLIGREASVVGRFGRRGTLKGSLSGSELRMTWREDQRHGWIALSFDDEYLSFNGTYGLGADRSPAVGCCEGRRTTRSRTA